MLAWSIRSGERGFESFPMKTSPNKVTANVSWRIQFRCWPGVAEFFR